MPTPSRTSTLLIVAAALALPSAARASCSDPTNCICHARGTTIFEVQRQSPGVTDGGGTPFSVVATFGPTSSSDPNEIVLPSSTPGNRALVADADPSRVVALSANGQAECASTVSHDEAIAAMRGDLDTCHHLVAPDWDGECHDAGCSCGSGSGPLAATLFVLALALLRGAVKRSRTPS